VGRNVVTAPEAAADCKGQRSFATFATMSARQRYTEQQRAEALALFVEHGPAEASKRTGIPGGTIASWGNRAGIASEAPERIRPAQEQRQATIAARKATLAERMLTKAEAILGQLDANLTEKHVKVVSCGSNLGSEVEIVEVTYDRPPTGDQKRIVDAVAVLVDKIQLLTGEATSRPEVVGGAAGEPAERGQLLSVVAKLAERAA